MLPLFLLAYRSAVHETTCYSPSQMLFGRDLRLPCDLLFGRPPNASSSPEEYIQDLQARFEVMHNFARERVNLATEKMKTRYDTRATGHRFNEGDKVWLWNPTRRKGFSPKLQSPLDGPYAVLNRLNGVVARIPPIPTAPPVLSTPAPKKICKYSEFTCASKNQCIPRSQICDFKEDCTDGSDEHFCGQCDFHEDMCGLSNMETWTRFRWERKHVENFPLTQNATVPSTDSQGNPEGYFVVLTEGKYCVSKIYKFSGYYP
ncbi:Apical endosomal glycoprotein, partial [Stegodyphus mimosarum]